MMLLNMIDIQDFNPRLYNSPLHVLYQPRYTISHILGKILDPKRKKD